MGGYAESLRSGAIDVAVPCESALNHVELSRWHLWLLSDEMDCLGIKHDTLNISKMEANITTVTSMLLVSGILEGFRNEMQNKK